MRTVNALQAGLNCRAGVQGFRGSSAVSVSICSGRVRSKLTRFGVHVFEHWRRRFSFLLQLWFWQIWVVMEDDRWNPVSSQALLKDLSNQNVHPSSTEDTTHGCNEKTVQFCMCLFPFCVSHNWWHDKCWNCRWNWGKKSIYFLLFCY